MSRLIPILITGFCFCAASQAEELSQHRPVCSPDGSRIVFMEKSAATGDDWELFLTDSNGNGQTRLTDHEGWDGYAVWSPDARKLLFDRGTEAGKHTAVYDFATGQTSRLGNFEGWMAVNDWSDDGELLLAFHDVDKKRDLYLLDTSGEILRRLTDTHGQNEHDAHFSPGSNKIAYARYPDDRSGSSLVTMDLRTGVTEVLKTSAGGIYGIDWSPDGTQLAYTDDLVGGEDSEANIYVVDVASKEVRQMTKDPSWDHMPVWTPDGDILFTSYRTGTELMYRVDHESGEVSLFEIKATGSE